MQLTVAALNVIVLLSSLVAILNNAVCRVGDTGVNLWNRVCVCVWPPKAIVLDGPDLRPEGIMDSKGKAVWNLSCSLLSALGSLTSSKTIYILTRRGLNPHSRQTSGCRERTRSPSWFRYGTAMSPSRTGSSRSPKRTSWTAGPPRGHGEASPLATQIFR